MAETTTEVQSYTGPVQQIVASQAGYEEGGWSKYFKGIDKLPDELIRAKEKRAMVIAYGNIVHDKQGDERKDFDTSIVQDKNMGGLLVCKPADYVAVVAAGNPFHFAVAGTGKDLKCLSEALKGVSMQDEKAVSKALETMANGMSSRNDANIEEERKGKLTSAQVSERWETDPLQSTPGGGISPENAAKIVSEAKKKNPALTPEQAATAILVAEEQKLIAKMAKESNMSEPVQKKLDQLFEAPKDGKAKDKQPDKVGMTIPPESVVLALKRQDKDGFVSQHQSTVMAADKVAGRGTGQAV